jgi:DNA-binding transcriptional regulator YdaS (Cro superfamily)
MTAEPGQDLERWIRSGGRRKIDVATLLGVTRPTLDAWISGTATPGPEHRLRLEVLTGIVAADWSAAELRRVASGGVS